MADSRYAGLALGGPLNQETFDTLAAADELRDAGFDEKHARAIISIQQNAGW